MLSNRNICRFLISTTLVMVSACQAAPADIDPPPPPAADAAAIAACGGRVSRSGTTLHLAAARGPSVELQDKINHKYRDFVHNHYELSNCADDIGLFIVSVSHYESMTQLLINQTNGTSAEVDGPIHVSPSKRALVVVETFGSGGESWNLGINVFHRLPDGDWQETWQYRPTDFSGYEFMAWQGEDTVRIATATWKPGLLVTGHETVLGVSPLQFLRQDGPESILSDKGGRYVDHIPGEM